MADEQKRRLVAPDVVKGVAILGVLATHLYLTPHSSGSDSVSLPMVIVYMSLMAFLVIAGYFYRPRGFVYNVKRRILKLAIVYVICTLTLPVILYGYLSILGYHEHMDFVSGYVECLKSLVGYSNVCTTMGVKLAYPDVLFYTCIGYYFIVLIIAASVVFYAVADLALKDHKVSIVSMAVMVALSAVLIAFSPVYLPFELELVPLAVAFMIFGGVLARINAIETLEEKGLTNWKLWAVLAGSLVFSLVLASIVNIGNGFHYAHLGDYGGWSAFPYFVEGCAVSVAAISLGVVVSKIPGLSHAFSFLGEHTLAILLLHVFLAKAIGFLITSEYASNYCPVLSLPVSLVVIIAVVIIASFIGIGSEKFATRVLSRNKA